MRKIVIYILLMVLLSIKLNSQEIYRQTIIELDNALNKKYYSEDSNITNDLLELKLNDEVLFKIKDGKIEKTYEGKDKIIEKLSKL